MPPGSNHSFPIFIFLVQRNRYPRGRGEKAPPPPIPAGQGEAHGHQHHPPGANGNGGLVPEMLVGTHPRAAKLAPARSSRRLPGAGTSWSKPTQPSAMPSPATRRGLLLVKREIGEGEGFGGGCKGCETRGASRVTCRVVASGHDSAEVTPEPGDRLWWDKPQPSAHQHPGCSGAPLPFGSSSRGKAILSARVQYPNRR